MCRIVQGLGLGVDDRRGLSVGADRVDDGDTGVGLCPNWPTRAVSLDRHSSRAVISCHSLDLALQQHRGVVSVDHHTQRVGAGLGPESPESVPRVALNSGCDGPLCPTDFGAEKLLSRVVPSSPTTKPPSGARSVQVRTYRPADRQGVSICAPADQVGRDRRHGPRRAAVPLPRGTRPPMAAAQAPCPHSRGRPSRLQRRTGCRARTRSCHTRQ
jgi:hypothetical protein